MSHQEDFSRLEAIVDKLLSTVDQLRRQNKEMKDALLQKEQELRSVRDASDGLHEERAEILAIRRASDEPCQRFVDHEMIKNNPRFFPAFQV